jgi:hypothetical protein
MAGMLSVVACGQSYGVDKPSRELWTEIFMLASPGTTIKRPQGNILRPPGSKYTNDEKFASPVRITSQGTIDSGIEK